jgi:hypothetical protein
VSPLNAARVCLALAVLSLLIAPWLAASITTAGALGLDGFGLLVVGVFCGLAEMDA